MNPFRTSRHLPLAVGLVLALLSTGSLRADGTLPDCYVVSAGIDNYPRENKLKGDVNDARSTTSAFLAQRGRAFASVHAVTLLDARATRANIVQRMRNFSRLGKAGDVFVIFLSGHGGVYTDGRTWYFCAYDESPKDNKGDLTQSDILQAADVLVKQAKKVVVIIDACYSGRLVEAARPYLNRYRDSKGGGLIVAVASGSTQTSNALGKYSAFARAFTDGLNGGADLNRDSRITVQELKSYSYKHTYELLRRNNNSSKQDSQVVWSPSISPSMALAVSPVRKVAGR